ncbi:GNAT family N-acetyltransferase [Pedobacter sp. KBW06]|nr:GNAT family N-acetyltransferase [Pedobacter sp. KBW06]
MVEAVKIREYHPDDKVRLLVILKLNVPKYFPESKLKDFEEYLENNIVKYFVVQLGEELIGGGGINLDVYNTGKISWDCISPKFQGLGIGRKLLKYRIEYLKSLNNVDKIVVRTSQLAHRFYVKNGFVLQNFIEYYWALGYHSYHMEMCILEMRVN